MEEIWKNSAVIAKRNIDDNQNPISVQLSELKQIIDVHSCIVLNQLPDEFYGVDIEGYVEVEDIDRVSGQNFKVDYSNGVIYFHPNNVGKTININYYGVGYTLLSASRIYTKYDKYGNVLETLEELIDKVKLNLQAIESMGGSVEVINRLENANAIGTELHENINNDIEIGIPLKNSLEVIIPQANDIDTKLKASTSSANSSNSTLKQTTITATNINADLTQNIASGNTTNTTLQQTIASGKDSVDKINGTGNKSLVIGASQFINNGYTWTHNMNSDNLIVNFMDSSTNEPLMPDYKIVDKNNILLKNSVEHTNIKVILSASYYQGNALNGTNVEEFVGNNIETGGNLTRLKDNTGYKYPVTRADAVYMPDGTTKISKKITDIESNYTLSESFNDESITIINEISPAVQGKLGDLSKLVTSDKTNLVNAINQTNSQLDQIEQQKANKSEVKLKIEKTEPEDFSQRALALVTGQGTINLLSIPQDSSVTIEKMEFATKGKNLFDKSKRTIGYNILHTTGVLTADSNYDVSDYMPIRNGVTYTISTRCRRYAIYNNSKVFISGVDNSAYTPVTFTSTIDGYLRFATGVGYVNTAQVEVGSSATSYERYKIIADNLSLENSSNLGSEIVDNINIKDKSVSLNKLDFAPVIGIPSINLFNKATVTSGKYPNYLTGNLSTATGKNASDYIVIEPNTEYIPTGGTEQVAFYDENKVFISGIATIPNSFTSPTNAKYIRVTVADSVLNVYMLEKGNARHTYETYGTKLPDSLILKKLNIITVKKDGTGSFTTIRSAIGSITNASVQNKYIVEIYNGEYDIFSEYTQTEMENVDFKGLYIPNYVDLVGVGNVVIKGTLQEGLNYNYNLISPINLNQINNLENLTITSTNCRYAVHDDPPTSSIKIQRNIKNCKFIKYIGDNLGYTVAYGSGGRNGAEINFEDCEFYSQRGYAYSYHNNINFTEPSVIKIEGCKFTTDRTDMKSVKFGSMGSGVQDIVKIVGCEVNKGIVFNEESSGSGVGIDFIAKGYSNDSFPIEIVGNTTKGITNVNGFIKTI